MQAPLISVVIAFQFASGDLFRLLDELRRQQLPQERFEVILVHNAPANARSRVARAVARTQWPFAVALVAERRRGLSRARNRGIQAARGRFVVVTDAETRPEPGWLAALVAAAQEERAFIVGGRVESRLPAEAARTKTRRLLECHGPLEWPSRRSRLARPYWITGCNLLFDREQALKDGLFREDLGRRGRLLLGCEDLEFVERARQRGRTVVIEPQAIVHHLISTAETTAGWYLRQGAGHGVSVARMRRSVTVPPDAVDAGAGALLDALAGLAAGWGFLTAAYAVEGARDLIRITAYSLETTRLRLLRPGSRR